MPTRERVQALIAMVEQGQFMEGLRTFYAEHATMQENQKPPRVGLPTLLAFEQQVLDAFEVHTRPVQSYLVDGDYAVINWVFEFIGHDGRRFVQDELAFQRWEGDQIVEERFYYDPGQQKPA